MHHAQRRSTVLLSGGALLVCLAVASVALQAMTYARAAGKGGVALEDRPKQVMLPAGDEYGVYFDDTDNSGYDVQCSITEANGQQVEQHDPWWTMSSSDTETLDIVFNTGSGRLTIACSSSAERVTVKPVPNLKALLIGIAVAVGLAGAGITALVVGTWQRSQRPIGPIAPARPDGAPAMPPPAWYPDPQGRQQLRYWDGNAWTAHVRSL